MTSVADLSPNRRGHVAEELQPNTGIPEASLFQPALQQDLPETAIWKAAATAASILDLPPLSLMKGTSNAEEDKELL
jgi:hypothetical protein